MENINTPVVRRREKPEFGAGYEHVLPAHLERIDTTWRSFGSLEFRFALDVATLGQSQVSGRTSGDLNPGSTARDWVEALMGRRLRTDRAPKLDGLVDRSCLVATNLRGGEYWAVGVFPSHGWSPKADTLIVYEPDVVRIGVIPQGLSYQAWYPDDPTYEICLREGSHGEVQIKRVFGRDLGFEGSLLEIYAHATEPHAPSGHAAVEVLIGGIEKQLLRRRPQSRRGFEDIETWIRPVIERLGFSVLEVRHERPQTMQ